MKAFTDLEQSKKLAEFLSFESADSHYVRQTHDFRGNTVDGKWSHPKYGNPNSRYANYIVQNFSSYETIPCWSLTTLFSMLPKSAYLEKSSSTELCRLTLPVELISSDWNLEPIDVCVEMIIKLHELNLL